MIDLAIGISVLSIIISFSSIVYNYWSWKKFEKRIKKLGAKKDE